MKFEKQPKFSDMAGKPVVAFTDADDKGLEAMQIHATPEGVRFTKSPVFHDMEELDAFAEALSQAWREHMRMRPKIVAQASGH